jgi:hypothetical protein
MDLHPVYHGGKSFSDSELNAWQFVTPWFLKRIEFYKVIYLNKQLFVAFMPLHIFLGVMKCSCILLCKWKALKFKFDLNSNWFVIYKTDLKKKKISYLNSAFGPNLQRGPAGLTVRVRPARPRWPTPQPNRLGGAHRVAEPKPDPLSQIRRDRSLTRPEPVIIPVKPFVRNRVYPVSDFFWIFTR